MNAKLKIAGALGAAALAVPGVAFAGSAVGSDGSSSSAPASQGLAPVQETQQERPDRDCPEKQGGSGSSSTETAL